MMFSYLNGLQKEQPVHIGDGYWDQKLWHFVDYRWALGHDRRDTTVYAGHEVTTTRRPVLCEYGFHAARRISDAFWFANSANLCEVRLGGLVKESKWGDKCAGQMRRVVATCDIKPAIIDYCRVFAYKLAASAPDNEYHAYHDTVTYISGLSEDIDKRSATIRIAEYIAGKLGNDFLCQTTTRALRVLGYMAGYDSNTDPNDSRYWLAQLQNAFKNEWEDNRYLADLFDTAVEKYFEKHAEVEDGQHDTR